MCWHMPRSARKPLLRNRSTAPSSSSGPWPTCTLPSRSVGRWSHTDLPTVAADATQLSQVFQNLIGNAIKYCRETPRVTISTTREGAEWLFSVRDNGIGMDATDAERIFGIFQRAHSAAGYPGTGIGLAICKKTIERHGGRIWAESCLGTGTTFKFTLPAREGRG